MYVSSVVAGCVVVLWVGGVMSKMSEFCRCVHKAFGRLPSVALCWCFE